MNRNRVSGLRITLTPKNCTKDEVREWMTAQRKLTNYASKHLLRLMKQSYDIAEKVFKNNSHYLAYEVHHGILLKHTDFREQRLKLGLRTSTNERLAAAIAGRFYHGYGQRNGGSKDGKWTYKLPNLPAITRQNKAIHVKDSVLTKHVDGDKVTASVQPVKGQHVLTNTVFKLQGLFGKIYEFEGRIPACKIHLLEFLDTKKNVDCNIFFTRKGNLTIVIKIDEVYELAYEPQDILGIDFNKRQKVFATMSDGEIIPLSNELKSLVDKVHEVNDTIHEIKSAKERQKYRYQWKNERTVLRKAFTDMVNGIIDKAKTNKCIIAIDGVTQAQGSFGHAELKEALVKRCHKENIPFIIVPSAHTSSDCAYCFSETGQYLPVARSKDYELISCNNCGKNYNADVNAALNIANDGKYIFWNTDTDFPKDKFGRAIRSLRPSTSVLNRKKKLAFVDFSDVSF